MNNIDKAIHDGEIKHSTDVVPLVANQMKLRLTLPWSSNIPERDYSIIGAAEQPRRLTYKVDMR